MKLYSYHRYVVIDEIEYELDATKVTASVNSCSPVHDSSPRDAPLLPP